MQLTEYRVQLVTKALHTILPLEHRVDSALHYFFKSERVGLPERALVAETVMGVLRHRLFLEFSCGKEISPRRLALSYLAKFGGYKHQELASLVKANEREWLGYVKSINTEKLSLPVRAEFPDWVIKKLQSYYTDEVILAMGQAMQQVPGLDLRVNTHLATLNEVLEGLKKEGDIADATPFSPIGIRVKNKPAVNKSPLFLTGKFEVQDEGSQLLGYLLAPKSNEMVVDFCAGAGGKTLMLGAMMNSKGRLYAFDVSEKRLNNLKPRLKRSGLSNLQSILIAHENDTKIKRLAGKIDRVLVDAPCSGLGTLKRNPDLKFRQSVQSVSELNIKQHNILAAASKLLKKGGRLVYATCSLLHEENQAVVEAFLSSHPEFKLLPAGELLAEQNIPLDMGKYMQLLPHTHGTDGFFAAVMELSS